MSENVELLGQGAVDARTVNDLKVSEDGRIAVISREGASNQRNGIALYDVTNPAKVTEVGRYDEGLTGGPTRATSSSASSTRVSGP